MEIKKLIKNNIIVPISLSFKKNLEIDYKNTAKHINFLIKEKVSILYLAQSASELERMSAYERIKIAKFVSKIINRRTALLLQPLAHTHIDDQINEAKQLMKFNFDALVIKPLGEKGKQDFYSTRFKLSEYNSNRHDDYYYNYMKKICNTLKVPIIFHHSEINNSKGLSIKILNKILKIKNIIALKEHNKSLKTRNKIYNEFSKKVVCFDGFSKSDFISSYKYGATAKHSNFSWFEPKWDRLFIKLLKDKKFNAAKKMCGVEKIIKDAIILTGYAGYKELVKNNKIISNQAFTRMPGCNLNIKQKKMIKKAYLNFQKKKNYFNFY